MNYQGSAALMDAEVKIYDAIDNSRLQMIGDQAIGELSYEQKQQLLLVRFGVTQNDEESIVTVNFVGKTKIQYSIPGLAESPLSKGCFIFFISVM